jgi:hypothetical protein
MVPHEAKEWAAGHAARLRFSRFVVLIPDEEIRVIVVPDGEIKKTRSRTERRGIPIGAALDPGTRRYPSRSDSCRELFPASLDHRSRSTRLFDKRLSQQEFTSRGVQNVKETVAISPKHRFDRFTAPVQVRKHRHLNGVKVPLVVARELAVPTDLSGIRVNRDTLSE